MASKHFPFEVSAFTGAALEPSAASSQLIVAQLFHEIEGGNMAQLQEFVSMRLVTISVEIRQELDGGAELMASAL